MKSCAAVAGNRWWTISLAIYEGSLDEATRKVMARMNSGGKIRIMWISGPEFIRQDHDDSGTLMERLQKQGMRFLMLNLDDYFWALVEHPTDWINDREFRDARGARHSIAERTFAAVARRQDH